MSTFLFSGLSCSPPPAFPSLRELTGGEPRSGGGQRPPRGGRVRERRRREDRGGAAPRELGGLLFRPPLWGGLLLTSWIRKRLEKD